MLTPVAAQDLGGGGVKRGVVFVAATGLAALVLFAFFRDKIETSSKPLGQVKIPEYQETAQPIRVKAGSEFAIVLGADSSTNGRWRLENIEEQSSLKLVEIKHSAVRSKRGQMGFKDLWIFRALHQGETSLAFRMSGMANDQNQNSEEKIFSVSIKS